MQRSFLLLMTAVLLISCNQEEQVKTLSSQSIVLHQGTAIQANQIICTTVVSSVLSAVEPNRDAQETLQDILKDQEGKIFSRVDSLEEGIDTYTITIGDMNISVHNSMAEANGISDFEAEWPIVWYDDESVVAYKYNDIDKYLYLGQERPVYTFTLNKESGYAILTTTYPKSFSVIQKPNGFMKYLLCKSSPGVSSE